MEIPNLETQRLLLRPYRPEDFETYAAINGDPEVMRYIRAAEDRPTAFRSFCAVIGHWTARGYGMWAVEERATRRHIGGAGLIRWEGRSLEIGYAFEPAAWGKGYATEASRRALDYAHGAVGARGVVAVIHPDNHASISVAQRIGARFDRELMEKQERLLVYRFPDPA